MHEDLTHIDTPHGFSPEYAAAFDEFLASPLDEGRLSAQDQLRTAANKKTNLIVIGSISQYAQTAQGATIIADRVLDGQGVEGLQSLTDFVPDPEHLTSLVHGIHKGVGVDFMPSPQMVCAATSYNVMQSLKKVQILTRDFAEGMNVVVPEVLGQSIFQEVENPDDDMEGPWLLDRSVAYAVKGFLEEQPKVAEWVMKLLHGQSQTLRADTARHNGRVVDEMLPLMKEVRLDVDGTGEGPPAKAALNIAEASEADWTRGLVDAADRKTFRSL